MWNKEIKRKGKKNFPLETFAGYAENAARSKLQGVENAGVEISGGRLFERMWYIDIVTLLS